VAVATATSVLHDSEAAADIAPDTMLKLWLMGDRLDGYRDVGALAAVASRNLAISSLRGSHASVELDEARAVADSTASALEARENDEEVDAILAALPDTQQAILRLRHVQGLETDEIARILGSTPGAVRVALSRARNRVKTIFLNRQN
jgi:RNA polymerase sigma-70 factor (ECF subfamily)